MNLTNDQKTYSITETMKIVPINPAIAEELEITKKKLEKSHKCVGRHKLVVVDEQLRTVTCETCGFVVDAFDYILAWAAEGEQRMEGLRRVEIQRRIAQAEHDDLKRKIKNMRTVLKRAGQPQSGVERNHFDMMRWNPHLVQGLDSENSQADRPQGSV